MDLFHRPIGQRIAHAARACEQRRTKHGRDWVTVFVNEKTIVIALHGCLTAAESKLVGSPAGAAGVLEYHQRVFAGAAMRQMITNFSGMVVRDSTVEIEPTLGSVVLLFTTDTAGLEFPLAPGRAATFPATKRGPRFQAGDRLRRATNATGFVVQA